MLESLFIIKNLVSGWVEWISLARFSPFKNTEVDNASASVADGVTTVTESIFSTGSPVRGSII